MRGRGVRQDRSDADGNGVETQLKVATWTALLEALRDHLTGMDWDHGQCGACALPVEGRQIQSRLTLAVMNDGAGVTTIGGWQRIVLAR